MIRSPKSAAKLLSTLALVIVPALSGGRAGAECNGLNLLDLMPAAERAELDARTDAHPYARGNFWRAEKDGASATIIGTYHLDDPRHEAAVIRFAPDIAQARELLVEAGPEEEKALQARIGEDPSLIVITDGPTLAETLPPETWDKLAEAARARGIPPFMAAKFRPWYLSVMLAIPPCAMGAMAEPNGLDHQLIHIATDAGVPVRALEPYDTLFTVFGVLFDTDQLAMVEQTLLMEDYITDFSETLADAYFDGDGRLMWEVMREASYKAPGYTRAQVDAEMAKMEDALMIRRNRAWIPVIEDAAAQGPIVVAFGALHLSGDEGVLNLLEQNGWTITAIDGPQ